MPRKKASTEADTQMSTGRVKLLNDRVHILGTEYKIEIHSTNSDKKLLTSDGYITYGAHVIVIEDMMDSAYDGYTTECIAQQWKSTLRHEIVHGFLRESGLGSGCGKFDRGWANNEEMVDWFALQGPKIMEAWKECGCL